MDERPSDREPRGVRLEVDGRIGRIVLDRPESSNAFDLPAAEAMSQVVARLADPAVRAITLTGHGARFCAGGDVTAFAAAADPAAYIRRLATVLEAGLRRLSELPKPVVAGVQGAVAGAGLAVILNADVVVAGRSTKFVMAYGNIGLSPDCGVSYLLPRAVGVQRALELALTGRVLAADEALVWGLVNEVVDDDAVGKRVDDLAGQIASGPAYALGRAKQLIRSSYDGSREDSMRDEVETIARLVATAEARELIDGFVSR